jgi:DNA (cytosine-5)-methyltransferase 1
VINAADYGGPQRRRRVYIFAYENNTKYSKTISKIAPNDVIDSVGLFAKTNPIEKNSDKLTSIQLVKNYDDLVGVSNDFKASFLSSGYMVKGVVFTKKCKPILEKPITLSKIVEKTKVDEHYFLTPAQLEKFRYLRGCKKIPRVDHNGHKYFYSEGAMSPHDSLNLPGRTMLTSEGTTNRSTHIILDKNEKKMRRLTPIECERLNQFPDNWTQTGMPENRRYFLMGNALVCGVIKRIGKQISQIIDNEL